MIEIAFETSRFNVSESRPHFKKPGSFGDDVLHWLSGKLDLHGARASRFCQQDWGWEMEVRHGQTVYLVGASGSRVEDAESPIRGEWRVVVQKKRSVLERALGKNRMSKNDPLAWMIESALQAEKDITNIRREANAA